MARKAYRGILSVPARLATEAAGRPLGAVSWPRELWGPQRHTDQQALFGKKCRAWKRRRWSNSLGLGLIGPTIIACGIGSAEETLYSQNSERRLEIWCQGFFRAKCPVPISLVCRWKRGWTAIIYVVERPKSLDQLRLGGRLVANLSCARMLVRPNTKGLPFFSWR